MRDSNTARCDATAPGYTTQAFIAAELRKLAKKGKTKFVLVRTGEERQGVVGLFQPGLVGEQAPGLSVRFTGINRAAIASYLVTLYNSLAVLTDDALAVLDDVAVDKFYEYK